MPEFWNNVAKTRRDLAISRQNEVLRAERGEEEALKCKQPMDPDLIYMTSIVKPFDPERQRARVQLYTVALAAQQIVWDRERRSTPQEIDAYLVEREEMKQKIAGLEEKKRKEQTLIIQPVSPSPRPEVK